MVSVQRLWLLQQLSSLGTVSAVAEAEHMTRPAVSQQLAKLESETGVPLLQRSGRNVELTGAGRALLEKAQRLFEELELVNIHIEEQRTGAGGEVRIGGFSSALVGLAVPAMEEIQYSLPGVAIRLYEMEPREALTALMNNQIDLAIVHDLFFDNTDKRLVAQQQLYTDRFYVILSRQHRYASQRALALSDLADELWAFNVAAENYFDFVTHALRSAGFEPTLLGHFRQMSTVLHVVAMNLGVTILPGMSLQSLPHGVIAVPVSERLERQAFLAHRRGRGIQPAVSAVADAVRSVCSARR
ncbi:LysR family transcriptional regulator [Saccharopolyspora phatthalungensis]|uniref:DNA-binding transcriptional LysR family regulator n=1 Tax=Saccharopolyspora phatthalungensis TaxID=664693 RepID=A0A840QH50_9PSEU|nr:LysR family transcriptional regulator [Saccharopolyspora phatthalungensis]MBB5159836.1 DNA-binding transcriptional LysR family regulator [Saccharopolyspora phatthalungensis]